MWDEAQEADAEKNRELIGRPITRTEIGKRPRQGRVTSYCRESRLLTVTYSGGRKEDMTAVTAAACMATTWDIEGPHRRRGAGLVGYMTRQAHQGGWTRGVVESHNPATNRYRIRQDDQSYEDLDLQDLNGILTGRKAAAKRDHRPVCPRLTVPDQAQTAHRIWVASYNVRCLFNTGKLAGKRGQSWADESRMALLLGKLHALKRKPLIIALQETGIRTDERPPTFEGYTWIHKGRRQQGGGWHS